MKQAVGACRLRPFPCAPTLIASFRVTKKERPLTPQHFAEFEQCYGDEPNGRAKRTDLGIEGLFRCFSLDEITARGYKLEMLLKSLKTYRSNMNYHYTILIRWSDEDQKYIVSLPEFGPYAHTHRNSYEEALKKCPTSFGAFN